MSNTLLIGPFDTHKQVLLDFGCMSRDIIELQTRWNEDHRQYHTVEHLQEILDLNFDFYKKHNGFGHEDKTGLHYKMLVITAFFHDAVYNPYSQTNEEDSAALFRKICTLEKIEDKTITAEVLDMIEKIILDTKSHTKPPSSDLSKIFMKFDLHGLAFGTLSRMISDEKKIFKEYGFVDYAMYKEERGKILKPFAEHIKKNINPNSRIDEYVDWFLNREVKIGVYAGTFYPMHKGHLETLFKAEKIFDKVILAFGDNPAKSIDLLQRKAYIQELRKKLPNHQIEMFEGMLTKFVEDKKYPVTIVKGLRNPSDFDAEKLQLRFMEDMDPKISIVYIISDRRYEHLSSSAIKMIRAAASDDETKKLLESYLV